VKFPEGGKFFFHFFEFFLNSREPAIVAPASLVSAGSIRISRGLPRKKFKEFSALSQQFWDRRPPTARRPAGRTDREVGWL
jgi:hypothetical protein